mgnify:CR=1 FL=1
MKKMMMIPLAAVTALAAGCASDGLYGGVGAGAGRDGGRDVDDLRRRHAHAARPRALDADLLEQQLASGDPAISARQAQARGGVHGA